MPPAKKMALVPFFSHRQLLTSSRDARTSALTMLAKLPQLQPVTARLGIALDLGRLRIKTFLRVVRLDNFAQRHARHDGIHRQRLRGGLTV